MIAKYWQQALWMLLAGLIGGPIAWAGDKPLTYDRISLSAEAQREVANDLLTAVLYQEREGSDAARLATEVNRAVEWAVAEAGPVKRIKVRTLEYRTHPLYNKQTLTGWRVRQSIRLESADTSALSALVGKLQKRLAVENIGYKLSPATRTQAENNLIGQAIHSFDKRARLITKQMGRPDYRLVSMDVQTGGMTPRPMQRGAMMAMSMDAGPSIKPGTQTVQVQVHGTIELRVQ